jgi:hypothetical protein
MIHEVKEDAVEYAQVIEHSMVRMTVSKKVWGWALGSNGHRPTIFVLSRTSYCRRRRWSELHAYWNSEVVTGRL